MERLTRHPAIVVVRAVLLAALLLGLVGTLVELLLLEHTEDPWQWVPIVLMGAGLVSLGWHALELGKRSLNVLMALMVLFVLSGLVGVWLHYRGNVEFELEMYPDLAGWKLFRDAMMGATPALAPGSMIQLGLIGLAWAITRDWGRGTGDGGRGTGESERTGD